MDNLLSIFERKAQEECIDEQKLQYLASKVAIWDHFGIPQAHYLALDTNEKSKMLNKYYKKLLPVYSGDGKNVWFFCLNSGFFLFDAWILACFWMFWKFYWCVSDEQHQQQLPGFIVDSGISAAVKDSTKLSITKRIFDGWMETTITAEKDPAGFKRSSTDLLQIMDILSSKLVVFL